MPVNIFDGHFLFYYQFNPYFRRSIRYILYEK